jgi:hypothetical protein
MKLKSLEVLLRGVRARALSLSLSLALLWRKPKTQGTHTTHAGRSLPRRPHLFSLKLSIYSKWRRPFANNIILLLLPTAALLLLALVYMCEQINAHDASIARAAHKNTKRGADEAARQRRARGGSTRGWLLPSAGPPCSARSRLRACQRKRRPPSVSPLDASKNYNAALLSPLNSLPPAEAHRHVLMFIVRCCLVARCRPLFHKLFAIYLSISCKMRRITRRKFSAR